MSNSKQIDLFKENSDQMIDDFLNMTIEDIFASRYANYSKYVIQDRALPDVRDGLKPVQRRILSSMTKVGNHFSKQYRQSAKTVGNVIGNYHPHGDTSVYDAMVRMSQTWKVKEQLVIMHGNNGSIDGDGPAAMRYTEAKLSKYSESLLEDINLNTVDMIPNFDDTELEPVVLPTRMPNLLINGGSGISTGYATDIPPHNPTEVIKATIKVNNNPDITLSQIMKIIKGPDFPTGAIVQGIDGLKQAYKTGKGKISLKAVIERKDNNLIIKEIPYEVNKSTLLQKIDLIRIDNKVDGISEIIDQSAEDFIEILIKCKKDANLDIIEQYLLKNTDLQKNYNFNMIAINNRKPELLGLLDILKSFIEHRRDVILKRSKFLLEKANVRLHIVKGISQAILDLDNVIKIIRSSQDKADAKLNLEKKYYFSEQQSEAIVNMQLYRLTNTDISTLREEIERLTNQIDELNLILNDFNALKEVVNNELEELLETYKVKRITQIEEEIEKIDINKVDLVKEEEVFVTISKNCYIKRTTPRSYAASSVHAQYSENDYLLKVIKTNTKENIYVFFDDGTYLILPVFEIADGKWKEVGKHLSVIANINDGVKVVNIYNQSELDNKFIVQVTRLGYYTKVLSEEFSTNKVKNKVVGQKLKADDNIVSTILASDGDDIFLVTNLGYYYFNNINNLEQYQVKRTGKKIAKLRSKQFVIGGSTLSVTNSVVTDKGGIITFNTSDLKVDKFNKLYTDIKSNTHTPFAILNDNFEYSINISLDDDNIIDVNKQEVLQIEDKLKQIPKTKKIFDITQKINI
ncbi:MAG: DNA topoisomerase IV subunit A [Mycoplasmatales bacterium]